MPGIEIPNSQIAGNALQYRTAADLLFRHMKDVNCVLPLLTCASFAIELYLKSLNAFSVYHLDDESDLGEEGQEFALEPSCDGDDEIEDSDVYRVTASPVGHGHKLEDLFNSINAPIRQQMEDKYRSETHTEFVDDLKPYNRTFVDARYCFEKSGGNLLGYGSISQIVRLSAFVSDFVICLLRKGT